MSTIAENLQKLVDAKNDIADAITFKGGTIAQSDGYEEFDADIKSIPQGQCGTLPLIFNASTANLVDYRIFGSDDDVQVPTVNLFDRSAGNYDIQPIYPTDGTGVVAASGTSDPTTWSIVFPVEPSTTYTISWSADKIIVNRSRLALYTTYPSIGDSCTQIIANATIVDDNIRYLTFTTGATDAYFLLMVYSGSSYVESEVRSRIENGNIQIEKNSTYSPYEPYGKYKFPLIITGTNPTFENKIESNVYNGVTFTRQGNKIIANGTATSNIFVLIDGNYQTSVSTTDYSLIPSGGYELSGSPADAAENKYVLTFVYDKDGQSGGSINKRIPANGTLIIDTSNWSNTYAVFYIAIWNGAVLENVEFDPKIIPKNFINVYTDTPLSSGESVTLADTDIDIRVGENNTNTINSVLTDKPLMYINYK